MQQISQPDEILRQKRPVQAQLRPFGRDDLGGDGDAGPVIFLNDCIAAGNMHHGKGQKGNS